MAENLPKEKRQSQIMEAAMKVFTKKGFASARMDDIVRESGLSKGAIYHHYNGKKDIFFGTYCTLGNTDISQFLQ